MTQHLTQRFIHLRLIGLTSQAAAELRLNMLKTVSTFECLGQCIAQTCLFRESPSPASRKPFVENVEVEGFKRWRSSRGVRV